MQTEFLRANFMPKTILPLRKIVANDSPPPATRGTIHQTPATSLQLQDLRQILSLVFAAKFGFAWEEAICPGSP